MRKTSKVLSVLLAIFFIWNVFLYFTNRDSVEMVTYGSIRDVISCEGQIIKDETLVKAPAAGMLQPYLTDCEKAGNGMAVAAILSGETNEDSKKSLTVLKSRISALKAVMEKNSFEEDVYSVDASLSAQISQIINYSANGEITRVADYKNDMIKLLDERSVIVNSNGDEILKRLDDKKKELEVSLGNLINEVISPDSGIFSAKLDGLEEKYTPENIDKLTLKALDEIKKTKPYKMSNVAKGDNVCKIINNFNWYLAVAIDKKQLGDIKEGSVLRIAFRDADGEVANALVHKILEEESGKHIVVFHLNRDVKGILSRRSVSIDIIRNTYKGFKIPMGALVYEDGVTGVYVVKGGERIFTPVEVLYHNENYLIAKEDNQKENALLLYDSVAVNGDMK